MASNYFSCFGQPKISTTQKNPEIVILISECKEECLMYVPHEKDWKRREPTKVSALPSSAQPCCHTLKQDQLSKNTIEEENSMEQSDQLHHMVHAVFGHDAVHQLEL